MHEIIWFNYNVKVLCISIISFATIFISCGTKKSNEINSSIPIFDLTNISKNEQSLKLSEIAISIDYVPITTTDSSILGSIYKIIKKESFFYIHSKDAIFQFNSKGDMLGKLEKTGKGPGEYIVIKDFDVNPSEQLIAILTWGKILFYNLNGQFYKSIKHDARFIDFVDDEKILTYQSNIRGNGSYSHIILDINGDTIATFLNKFQFDLINKPLGLPSFEYLRFRYNDELFVSEIQDDTLFKVTNENTLLPHSIFYTGDKRLTAIARATGAKLFKHLKDYIYLTRLMETSRYIFYSDQMRNQIYDKKDDITYDFTRISNDIDGGLDFQPRFAFNKRYIITTIDAFKFKEHVKTQSFEDIEVKDMEGKRRIEQLANGLSDEDNPVIMIVKLKE